jgi:elongation factor 3
MLWRYQTGEDLEEMSKANRQISEEELQKMKDGALIVVEGQKRLIDEIIARKKLKQSYEYEVSFKGLSSSENIWLPRDDLVKRGFEKVHSSYHLMLAFYSRSFYSTESH